MPAGVLMGVVRLGRQCGRGDGREKGDEEAGQGAPPRSPAGAEALHNEIAYYRSGASVAVAAAIAVITIAVAVGVAIHVAAVAAMRSDGSIGSVIAVMAVDPVVRQTAVEAVLEPRRVRGCEAQVEVERVEAVDGQVVLQDGAGVVVVGVAVAHQAGGRAVVTAVGEPLRRAVVVAVGMRWPRVADEQREVERPHPEPAAENEPVVV